MGDNGWMWLIGGLIVLVGLLVIAFLLRDDRSHGPMDTARHTDTVRTKEPTRPMEPTGLLNPHKGTPARDQAAAGAGMATGQVAVYPHGLGGARVEEQPKQPTGADFAGATDEPPVNAPPAGGPARSDVRAAERAESAGLTGPARDAAEGQDAYNAPSVRHEGGIQASNRPMGTPVGQEHGTAGDEGQSDRHGYAEEAGGGLGARTDHEADLPPGEAVAGRKGGYSEPKPSEPRLPGSDGAEYNDQSETRLK